MSVTERIPLVEVIQQAKEQSDTPLILTPNRRLATRLSLTYDQLAAKAENQAVWQRWVIMPWSEWLTQLWEEWQLRQWMKQGSEPSPWLLRQPLSPLQEQIIWQRIIADSAWGERLLNPMATAKLAREAAHLMSHYGVARDELLQRDEPDGLQFLAWWDSMQQQCDEAGWLPAADLLHTLKEVDIGASLERFDALFLYGFRYVSPADQEFLEQIEQRYHLKVKRLTLPDVMAPVALCAGHDLSDEYQQAIAWAWHRWQTSAQHTPPRIGIVVPELDRDRGLIQRLIYRHCQPRSVIEPAEPLVEGEKRAVSREGLTEWINISGGVPLWDTPLLKSLEHLLLLMRSEIDLTCFTQLIRTPFIGGAEREALARHALERSLRQKQHTTVSWDRLHMWLTQWGATPDLHARLEVAKGWLQRELLVQSDSLEGWLKRIRAWLGLWGWPGERTLSTHEYQMQNKWFELQTQFLALEVIHPVVTLSHAVTLLRQAGEGMTYQSQSEEAPIQVLGLLEADGQTFDFLWITGLQSELWPQPIKPNPLLPAALQRHCLMPHASPERELALAKQLLQDFRQAARIELILSWPQQEDDRPLMPSPLLRPYLASGSEITRFAFDSPLELWSDQSTLVRVPEQYGAALPEDRAIQGGTAIIKDQGACPFRAYVRFRLSAQAIEPQRLGFSPAERGEAVHFALEHFWRQTESSERLAQMSESVLENAMSHHAQRAMAELLGERKDQYSHSFLALESERLIRLTLAWLAHERARTPFKVVAVEQEQVEIIEGFEMRLRVDRIDQIAQRQFLIIDYKTGIAKIGQWLDDALEEPQLPIYCITSNYDVCGIAFGKIKAGEYQLNALVQEGVSLFEAKARHVKCAEDWPALVAQWRQAVEARIKAFRSGWAVVNPRQGDQTCRYCPYPSVCRKEERQLYSDFTQ